MNNATCQHRERRPGGCWAWRCARERREPSGETTTSARQRRCSCSAAGLVHPGRRPPHVQTGDVRTPAPGQRLGGSSAAACMDGRTGTAEAASATALAGRNRGLGAGSQEPRVQNPALAETALSGRPHGGQECAWPRAQTAAPTTLQPPLPSALLSTARGGPRDHARRPHSGRCSQPLPGAPLAGEDEDGGEGTELSKN